MITIKNLGFGYGRELLFQHMDLTLEPGNIYGLLGLNGAGKSSLLKLATGLLFTHTGTVRTLGYDPARRDPGLLSQIFMLPEELNLPSMTDREYLKARAPFYPRFDLGRFERYVDELELPRRRKLTALSYGQKKKFLLAFGLACRSPLLLLDEPTNGLDIPSKGLFRRLVAEALTEQRLFIISTHQVRDVESLIDPIVILHGGKVLLNCTMAEISSRIRMSHNVTRPGAGADNLLYCEPAVGGYWSVWQDANAGDGRLDLEVLFNTTIAKPAAFADLFDATGEAA